MQYTIDASGGEDRTRILFTDPYEFEVDLRYLRVHSDPAESQLAVNWHFAPADSNALVAFLRGLTPEQLAGFANGMAEHAMELAAELEG